jgi:localization factor PodJL
VPSAQPTADETVSLVRPEVRVSDMIDNGATGSIQSSAFTKPAVAASVPGRMVGEESDAAVTKVASATPTLPELFSPPTPTVVETFDLPPEGVGPIALRQAAADGDARAQFEIAAIYTEGRAVEQDYLEAAKWYERSAVQGLVPAQYRLGNLYETGTGVEQDLEVARLWYQRAAEAGNRMAMHNLAALYASGALGEQQFDTAAEWFQQAADHGMTDSQFNLGMLYARGLGVEQDPEQSYKWFALAARSGDADAAKSRDDIAKSLNADALARLQSEVAAWQPQPIELASNFAPLGTWSPSFDPGQPITTRDVVSKVQQAFVRLGFDVGTPDGLTGPKTVDAIKAFERGTGMTEVGAINPRLLAVLGSQPV